MKNTKFLSAAAAILALLGSAALADSCKKDNTEPEVGKGTVSGVVTNNLGTPIIDVEVSISGTEIKATTSVDGSYTLENVPMTKQTVFFKKEGYAEGSSPINASSFKNGKATVDMVMDIASAKITGKCIDAKNNNAGMAGVTVKLNGAKETQTDADGVYVFDGLTIDDYNLVFSAPGCVDVVRSVSKDQFVGDFVVTLTDVRMGAKEILPGATAEDLGKVDVWHYNEYRGGKNGDDYPHFDWSTDYMATFTSWYGWHEEQNEGTTIQIRNREADGDWKNPADHEKFDSYLAGRKKITADNCILAIKMRTHASSEDAPCHWGVMVIDINAAILSQNLLETSRFHGTRAIATQTRHSTCRSISERRLSSPSEPIVGKPVTIGSSLCSVVLHSQSRLRQSGVIFRARLFRDLTPATR